MEPILPPALLYIFGAGHVAFNLCQTAANAGFDVTVTDDRSSYATKERFPAAHEVHALDFEKAMRKLDPERIFLYRRSSPADIATTCASCAGPCRRERATWE